MIRYRLSNSKPAWCPRSGQNWTERFAQLVPSFQALGLDGALLDGEIVIFDGKGHSRFAMLQNALKGGNEPISFMAFDLLVLGGKALCAEPLHERKAALAKLLKGAKGAVRYSDHVEGNGERMQAKACAMGLEGVVSKREDAAYRAGRSRIWLKSKCAGRDEFVIGGWLPSKVAGRPFASLLLGEFDGNELIYRGRVGTGFDDAEMTALSEKFRALSRKTPPFKKMPQNAARGAKWVSPRLVAEIAYTERTQDGYLRHPSYLGLREDKPAKSVESMSMSNDKDAIEMAGVRLTSPAKVLFPEQGVTKRDLARYLLDTADQILPHLARRLLLPKAWDARFSR